MGTRGQPGWDRHERVAAAGTGMHAAVRGPDGAPVVVCVHGLGCSYRYFLPLANELAPEFQVFAVDLPGFGATPGPRTALDVRGMGAALTDWLRVTDRAGATLVGDSAGSQVIIEAAAGAPAQVGPMVLAGPTFDRTARSVPRQLLRMARNGLADRTGPALVPIRLRDRRDSGLRRYLRTALHCLRDPVEQKAGRVAGPAVVVRGGRDPIVPEWWARELVELLPAGRLATIEGHGHTVNFAAPAELAAVVRRLSGTG